MQNKSDFRTDNHKSVLKAIRQKKKRLIEKVGIIDGGRGLPYVNVYTLLYQLVDEAGISPSNKILRVAEYIVFLNPHITLDILQRSLKYLVKRYLKISAKEIDLSLLQNVLDNIDIINVEPNDMQRYAPGRLKNTQEQNINEIVKYRSERCDTPFARIKARFHGLIDSHRSNWADISPRDFPAFDNKLLNKHFDSIFNEIYEQRQRNLKAYFKKRNRTYPHVSQSQKLLRN